jgi:hypothetical protein
MDRAGAATSTRSTRTVRSRSWRDEAALPTDRQSTRRPREPRGSRPRSRGAAFPPNRHRQSPSSRPPEEPRAALCRRRQEDETPERGVARRPQDRPLEGRMEAGGFEGPGLNNDRAHRSRALHSPMAQSRHNLSYVPGSCGRSGNVDSVCECQHAEERPRGRKRATRAPGESNQAERGERTRAENEPDGTCSRNARTSIGCGT